MSDGKFFICTLAPRYERFQPLVSPRIRPRSPWGNQPRYRGTLSVEAIKGLIVPIVTMDLEAAVAAVVAAESAPGAPMETKGPSGRHALVFHCRKKPPSRF